MAAELLAWIASKETRLAPTENGLPEVENGVDRGTREGMSISVGEDGEFPIAGVFTRGGIFVRAGGRAGFRYRSHR